MDWIGMARLFFFVLTHPVGTFRFIQEIAVLIRILSVDVFGQVYPIVRRDPD